MKFKRTISVLLSVLMIFSSVMFALPVNAEETSIADQLAFLEYNKFTEDLMTKFEISGVAYVTRNGQVLCQVANGMANPEENKEMTVDTLFPIGSISKQFCAVAVLILQEQGKLNVNETIDKYFPEYTIGKDITIKNLLTMRAGVRDYVNSDDAYIGQENPTEHYTLTKENTPAENKKIIKAWLFTQELKFAPDTKFSYSNSNTFLLSEIVEMVSGKTYNDFLKENIFKPLEMTNTGFYEELYNSPNLAKHCWEEGEDVSQPYYRGLAQGSGDLVSNAKDMDKWMSSLRECKIISEESLAEMTTNYSIGTGYGYCVYTRNLGKFYHNGHAETYESSMMTFTNQDFNVFVVTNDFENCFFSMETLATKIQDRINQGIILGDINGDDGVNIKDATLIQSYVAKLADLSETEKLRADVNMDTGLNIKDASEIQMFVAKFETDLSIGEIIA